MSEIVVGVGEGGLIFCQLILCLGESDFKLVGVDLCQQVVGFDLLIFLEVKVQQLVVDLVVDGDGVGCCYCIQFGEIVWDCFFGGGGCLYWCQCGVKVVMVCVVWFLWVLFGGGSFVVVCFVIVLELVGGFGDNYYCQCGVLMMYVIVFYQFMVLF